MLQSRCEKAARRIIVLGRGDVTAEDIRAFLDWQILEGLWEYGILYDLRSVTGVPGDAERANLAHFVTSMAAHLPRRGPVATVTHDPEVIAAVTSFGEEAARAGLRVRAFREEPEALRWLDDETGETALQFRT